MIALDALGLTRLLQLASPALPVGAYSYSQGLEAAIENGCVSDAASAGSWIRGVLEYSVGSFEAPLLWRMLRARRDRDDKAFSHWNTVFRCGRETAELRAETLQMAHGLCALLPDLPSNAETLATDFSGWTFPAAYSCAAHRMGVESSAALLGYLWSWLENQVLAAVKAVPLGHRAGQKLLAAIGADLPRVSERAMQLADDELSNFAPGLAIASSRHETQYSRLFRS